MIERFHPCPVIFFDLQPPLCGKSAVKESTSMVTVKEVAKHAGVSLATVSRVINGAENVSPVIRE